MEGKGIREDEVMRFKILGGLFDLPADQSWIPFPRYRSPGMTGKGTFSKLINFKIV